MGFHEEHSLPGESRNISSAFGAQDVVNGLSFA
jgi:hypothetical protein